MADDSQTGDIDTLVLKLKKVHIRPVAKKASDMSPDFRGPSGRADLGAAWTRPGKDNNVYRTVCLDAPSLGRAITAALVDLAGVPPPGLIARRRPLGGPTGQPARRSGGAGAARAFEADFAGRATHARPPP